MPSELSFFGDVACLEIARGHDGFLRGDPEPVLILAVYLVDGVATRLIGRSLHRFRAHSPFPSQATVDRPALPSCSVRPREHGSLRWVVLAIALEEDGCRDVQRMFGAVEHHRTLSVWVPDSAEPDPVSVATLAETNALSAPREVDLLVDGHSAAATCTSDKWIGSVCWWLEGRGSGLRSRFRLPFLSADGRNDWTAIVDVAH
jgi:hypothetical protein